MPIPWSRTRRWACPSPLDATSTATSGLSFEYFTALSSRFTHRGLQRLRVARQVQAVGAVVGEGLRAGAGGACA